MVSCFLSLDVKVVFCFVSCSLDVKVILHLLSRSVDCGRKDSRPPLQNPSFLRPSGFPPMLVVCSCCPIRPSSADHRRVDRRDVTFQSLHLVTCSASAQDCSGALSLGSVSAQVKAAPLRMEAVTGTGKKKSYVRLSG